jgi:catechol 2,3-dioxygenase-like lactoylglutathione lyase family enzyme
MVHSVGFVGVRTQAFDQMVTLYRDVLGLDPVLVRRDAAWFRASDGAQIHVYGPSDRDHAFFDSGPVVGLLVDDFDATRTRMIESGCVFIGEPQRDGGAVWNHYRAPDGNVYEIICREEPAG